MKKPGWVVVAGLVVVAGAAFYAYQRHAAQTSSARNDVLTLMPSDASAVVFADLAELRSSSFLAQLYSWAPAPSPDADYAQFLKDTGFNYERDLDRFAVALKKAGEDSTFLAVVDGKFDRQKISALALKSGAVTKIGSREIFILTENGGAKKISFTFLRNDRIVLTDSGDLSAALNAKKRNEDSVEWRSRFGRLAGSPVFAVIRQDAAPGAALSAQAPSGFRSPQLSTLVDQLQWITLAGKPENDRLRVIAEGEAASPETMRALADLLNGILLLAQSGLNDAKTRQQLDPALREAYLEMLKSADVSTLDRGETKSVRLVFEITPAFLESASRTLASSPNTVPGKPPQGNAAHSRKGHT
jgi:hypothetical protein